MLAPVRNNGTFVSWPAEFDITNSIVVGNSTPADTRFTTSNYGVQSVDIFAPGVNHRTMSTDGDGNALLTNDTGTSMAAPIVAGVCAMVWDDHPAWTPKEVRDRVISMGDLVPGLAGLCGGSCGCRRLNPVRAVTGADCP